MNDIKNLLIAYLSTMSSLFTALDSRTLITIVSAIVLPILFFTLGKTIDVVLQIYLENKRKGNRSPNE